MNKCSGITKKGERCQSIAITGSDYCHGHHPDREEQRKKAASRGGRTGGRGRPQVELTKLQERFEALAAGVLSGKVEKGKGAVACQLLQGARACVRDRLKAIEQESILERVEELEEIAARQNEYRRQAW
jgi:hypothetical protein